MGSRREIPDRIGDVRTGRRLGTIHADELRAAVADGYRTLKDIGNDFGVSREYIRQLYIKYGIDPSHKPWDKFSRNWQRRLSPRSPWPREGLPALKRRLGLCLAPGCEAEAAPRVRCTQHRQVVAQRVERIYKKHLDQGLCYHCDNLPVPGHTMCEYHLDYLRKRPARQLFTRHKSKPAI